MSSSGIDQAVDETLVGYYRLPRDLFACESMVADCRSDESGFFQFGRGNICYGRSQSGAARNVAGSGNFAALEHVRFDGKMMHFPFRFGEVIDNLRLEHYRRKVTPNWEKFTTSVPVHKLYYFVRGCLPAEVRRRLQRLYFQSWKNVPFPAWPVDFTVDNLHEEYLRLLMEVGGSKKVPFIWFWPKGADNCLILTHDVETLAGRDFTSQLMDLDDSFGFKSSFEVVPEKRYEIPDEYVNEIRSRGFEFNLHDLNHDGGLYLSRQDFLRHAAKINGYVRRYNARGFRAGSMYRNQDWYAAFEFSYDMSVPNVAHLDPMRGGCCTVMPYFVGRILELPLTISQDYTLFHILNDYSIDLWKQQLGLISERNGLMSILTHPDYLVEERASNVYMSLLDYLQGLVEREKLWVALPGDVDSWWRARSEMRLVQRGNDWEIVGPDKERARLAYACLDGDHVVYERNDSCSSGR